MDVWNGNWQRAGRARFTFQDASFLSLIQNWDATSAGWENFLRYRIDYNDNRRPVTRTGMQAWNTDVKAWENRAFTRRITHFWSSPTTAATSPLLPQQLCRIPNPYPPGAAFSCPGLTTKSGTVQIELMDMWGRLVHRSVQPTNATLQLPVLPLAGTYVVRLHDGNQLFHLQKVVIP
ncbi:MAG: T9SS type A sorting domain-containing protein [Bacteroidota bacterium]